MKHKYKIRQKIYVPRDPAVGHYVEYYDYIGIVVGYVESFSAMPEHYRQYYLLHGFEYVCASVVPDCGVGHLIGEADVFKEEELVKYKGRALDWRFDDLLHCDDYFEEELEKNVHGVSRREANKPFQFWKMYIDKTGKEERPVYNKEKGEYEFPSDKGEDKR